VIPAEIRPQVESVVDGLKSILGDDFVGVYLHGSAVLDCFGPRSDIDLVAVSTQAVGDARRRSLVEGLLRVSVPYDSAPPLRPIELDLVLATALDPWRYPTPLDFHYSEEFRPRFEAGELEAWESLMSRDLAAHITVLHHAGVALHGPSIEETFPDVPYSDYLHALTHDLAWCRTRFAEMPRYGVLSVARIWATVATGVPHSKATGAEWALPKLPAAVQPVLEHGRDLYIGAADDERWQSLPVPEYIETVADEIDRLV